MRRDRKRGFMLTEFAFIIVISGLLSGMGVKMLLSHLEQKKIEASKILVQQIKDELVAYYDFHGFLPCPAKLDLAVDHADAGKPQTCNSLLGDMVIGAVPFQEVGFDKKFFGNLWGNKFLYVIPRKLGIDDVEFRKFDKVKKQNIIEIQNKSGENLNDGKVAFLLVDHRQSGAGAYKIDGTAKLSGTTENSNDDSVFEDLGNGNLAWKSYDELLMIGDKREKSDNIIIDKLWFDNRNPPQTEGAFLIIDSSGYRKLQGKAIPNYTILLVQKKQGRLSSRIKTAVHDEWDYIILNYLQEGDIIFHKTAGNFTLTADGLKYLGENFEDFGGKTLKIKEFRDYLPTSDNIFILNRFESTDFGKVEGLSDAEVDFPTIRRVDGGNALVSKVYHNQTIFDRDSGHLKKYDRRIHKWINWESITGPESATDLIGWCGSMRCKIPGIRPCGPMTPDLPDRDLYGRFVVRDLMIGKNNAVFKSDIYHRPADKFWPTPSDFAHHGIYFSYWALDSDDGETEHPSQNLQIGVNFQAGRKRFLVKIKSDNKWHKYSNTVNGFSGAEEDIKDFVTEKGNKPFEICKDGIGVFAAYDGLILDESKDDQPPFLAVLDGENEITIHQKTNSNYQCCDDIKKNRIDDGVYVHKYDGSRESYSPAQFSFSCLQNKNWILYHINPSIGQLNPILGGLANQSIDYKLKTPGSSVENFDNETAEAPDNKFSGEYYNKDNKFLDWNNHVNTNSYRNALTLGDVQIATLNTANDARKIAINDCKLKFEEEFKYQVKWWKQINPPGSVYSGNHMIFTILDNFANANISAENNATPLMGWARDFGAVGCLIDSNYPTGNIPYDNLKVMQYYFYGSTAVCRNSVSGFLLFSNRMLSRTDRNKNEKHKINFGKVYLEK